MISMLQWVHFRWSESEERQKSSPEGGVLKSKAQEWENVGSESTEVSKVKRFTLVNVVEENGTTAGAFRGWGTPRRHVTDS